MADAITRFTAVIYGRNLSRTENNFAGFSAPAPVGGLSHRPIAGAAPSLQEGGSAVKSRLSLPPSSFLGARITGLRPATTGY